MSTIVRYSSGSTYTLVPNKVDIEKVQDLDGQYHIPNTSIVGMMRLGLGVQRITVSGDALDMSACLWHDVVAISFDSGTSYQTVYFAGVPYTSDCWSGIYPYALSLLASPLKEQTATRYPTTGYKFGNQSITGISQVGNVSAFPTIHYLAPLFYAPLSNTLLDFSGQSVTFTRTAPKTHNGIVYPINTPIFDQGLYLASDTAQDVATWTPPAALRNVVYCMGDSLTAVGQWEAQLISHLGATWEAVNLGISGNLTSQMLTRFGSVTAPGNGEYVVILGGINDILNDVSAADIETSLQGMYDAAFAAGIKVVAVTITPFKSYALWSSGKQAILDAVNTWILNTATHVDYRVNAYTALEDPAIADTLLPAYDSDHLHLSAAGYIHLGDTIFVGATWAGTPVLETSILKTIAMQIKQTRPITGTNLITNGEFETDVTGWTADSGSPTRDTAAPIIGTGSLKYVSIGNASHVYSLVTLIVGHTYYLAGLMKSSACGGGRKFRAGVYSAGDAGWRWGTPVDVSATAVTVNFTFVPTNATSYLGFGLDAYVLDENMHLDSVICYDLTALFGGNLLNIWSSAQNHLYIDIANNLLKWSDETTDTISVAFPIVAWITNGTPFDVVLLDDTSHAVTLAVHPAGGAWTTASGTLAAILWPQLTLGNLEGSIANLIQYPYVLTSAEYQALAYSSLSLLYNTLYVGNRYAGEIVKGSDGRLVNAAGSDISALLGGSDIPIGAAAVTIAQSQGLSARWYVEVKRTDV